MMRHRQVHAAGQPTAALPDPTPIRDEPAPASQAWPAGRWSSVGCAPTACCCAASPVVQAVLPPAGDRPSVELLLCGHHFRASRAALAAKGALFFDLVGSPLGDEGDPVFAPVTEQLFT